MERYIKLVNGIAVDMSPEEIAERQAEEALPPPPLSTLEKLKGMFTSVPVAVQSQLGETAAAVFLFLSQENPQAAKQKISDTPVPPELEQLKAEMLEAFSG